LKKVITRFAPSPTGTLHIGGVRTALFNYVYAKKHSGKFLVRIEDTDRERSTKEFERNILESLDSIGLSPDENPINQSERGDVYQAAAQKIIDSEQAYYCNCSVERLEKMRSEQQANGQKPQYDRYTVYKNPYMLENTILVGFRGQNFLETGAVYAPYVPLIMTPLVYDPKNFTPRKGVMTRYAKKMVRPEFYGKVIVADVNYV
jgi:hypothetical protein